MTVSELIDQLQSLNGETEIYIDNGDGIVKADEIEIDNYYGFTRKVVIK
jgi:hypothetical protein